MAQTPSFQRHNSYERLLNIIGIVKPGEGRGCILLTLNACLLMFAYYLLKVVREPLILAYGGAEYKSYATAIQALVLVIALPLFSVLYHQYAADSHRSNIIRKVLLFFVSNLLLFVGLQLMSVNIGIAFYIWLGLFSVMVVAQFWAYAADLYNIKAGQRLFVIIAIGATLGSWIGSRIAGLIFPVTGIVGIMLLASFLLLLCALLSSRIDDAIPDMSSNKEQAHPEDSSHQWMDGFSVVFKNHYLLTIAIFVTILVFINSTGEYILARLVSEESQRLLDSNQILDSGVWQGEFYASYYSWITLGSFLIQAFLVSRLFRWIGIRGAVLVLPVIMIIGYGFMLFFPIFSLIRIAMTVENSANYSVQNTTRHALFLPVPRKLKYLGKTTIETFFYRFGDLLYGVFIYLSTLSGELTVHHYVLINLFLAVVLFMLAWNVGHRNLHVTSADKKGKKLAAKAKIPQLVMTSGDLYKFSVSECTFIDPHVGDALHYHAKKESGEQLPSWIEFDQMSRTFTFEPPLGYEAHFVVKVIAMDFDGDTATSFIELSIKNQITTPIGI